MTIKPVKSFARIGSLSSTYAEVAEKSYSDYLKYSANIKKIGKVEYSEELEDLKYEKELLGLQTIVFSAMCFEAAIFDFASVHLGDDYVKDHLDKLDTLSKWVVVLRFVSNTELQKDESPYGTLKKLIQARNKLVHTKSENFKFEPEQKIKQIKKFNQLDKKHETNIDNAFRSIVIMSLYLERTQNEYYNPLPSFSDDNAPMRRYHKELKGVIVQCRQSVLKTKCS